jgi:hypothetical protein
MMVICSLPYSPSYRHLTGSRAQSSHSLPGLLYKEVSSLVCSPHLSWSRTLQIFFYRPHTQDAKDYDMWYGFFYSDLRESLELSLF